MLQCRQGGEGDETAKGHWPAPEGELAGTAFSAAQPVGAVPVLSVPTGRNGSGQLYGPAAQPGRRVGELPGALSKYCVPSGCPQHLPLSLHLHPGAAGRQPALSGAAWRGKTAGGLFQKRPPAPLCDPCCQHRCVMEGAFLRQGAGQRPAGGAGETDRGLYGQQRGLLGADFHLPLAKQRVRYAAVAGGSGDHPPALV